jgi:mRNA interferase RelE/StbE
MNDTIYEITFRRSVKNDIKKIPKKDLEKIFLSIENLKSNPIPKQTIKLKGSDSMYRIREGDYRIVYEIEFNSVKITIIRVRHRTNVYRE